MKIKTSKEIDMKYRIRKYSNPQNFKETYWGMAPVYSGHMDIKEISKMISNGCTLTATDIQAVLSAFIEHLPDYLCMGYILDLGELGHMKLIFSSLTHLKKELVTSAEVKGLHVSFVAGSSFKEKISSSISFEPYTPIKEQEEKSSTEDESTQNQD